MVIMCYSVTVTDRERYVANITFILIMIWNTQFSCLPAYFRRFSPFLHGIF